MRIGSALSLNVWFGNLHDANDVLRVQRTKRICEMLVARCADVVFLQEVHYSVASLFMMLMSPYYYISDVHMREVERGGYGTAVLVSNKYKSSDVSFEYVPYTNTEMSRGMAIARMNNCLLISTHLESLQQPECVQNRQLQLQQLYKLCESSPEVIVGMDSNTKRDLPGLPSTLTDVIYTSGKKPPMTWFANRYFGFHAKACYDRLLVRGINVVQTHVLTCEDSDHDAVALDAALDIDD